MQKHDRSRCMPAKPCQSERVDLSTANADRNSPSSWLDCKTLLIIFFLVYTPALIEASDVPFDYNYGMGPLNIRQTSPGQNVRLTLPNLIPGTIRPGWSANASFSTSNVWLNENAYLIDYEILDMDFDLRFGINKRMGVVGFVDHRMFYGGILDGFIEGFHDLFNLDQDGRDQWPQYETWFITYDDQGNTVYSTDKLNDLYANVGAGLAFQYIVTRGDDRWLPAVGITAIGRYGLDVPSSPQAPWDLAVQMGLSKRIRSDWYLFAALGRTYFNQTRFDRLPFEMTDQATTAMMAIAWHLRPELPLLAQYQYHDGTVKGGIGSLGDATHEITLGVKWSLRHGHVLEFGMTENFGEVSNSADFGLHVGYGYHFGQSGLTKQSRNEGQSADGAAAYLR